MEKSHQALLRTTQQLNSKALILGFMLPNQKYMHHFLLGYWMSNPLQDLKPKILGNSPELLTT